LLLICAAPVSTLPLDMDFAYAKPTEKSTSIVLPEAFITEIPQMQFSQTYGGSGSDIANYVIQTSDGGYAIVGETDSYGAGYFDLWLVKTDAAGNIQWNKTFGDTHSDYAFCVIQTSDGGYMVAGFIWPTGAEGNTDAYLVKTDSLGNKEWDHTYGGSSFELAYCVIQTSNGGYVFTGVTGSYGAGSSDFWLVKIDASGNMEWDKTYGGAKPDQALHIIQTSDGGYAITGYEESFGAGWYDAWLIKTDSAGEQAGKRANATANNATHVNVNGNGKERSSQSASNKTKTKKQPQPQTL